jgi:hypothetical protein
MNFATVQQQLNDLPVTFRRIGVPYTQFIDSLAAAMTRLTMAVDGLLTQGNFSTAVYGWLDAWGLLFNIARRICLADSLYRTEISYATTVHGGPPLAIGFWLYVIYGVQVEIVENFPGVGYMIYFPATVSVASAQAMLHSLSIVRPAGVPFNAQLRTIGTYLRTVDFLGAPKATGAYLGGGQSAIPLGISASTNSSVSNLPDLFLTDPTLNA